MKLSVRRCSTFLSVSLYLIWVNIFLIPKVQTEISVLNNVGLLALRWLSDSFSILNSIRKRLLAVLLILKWKRGTLNSLRIIMGIGITRVGLRVWNHRGSGVFFILSLLIRKANQVLLLVSLLINQRVRPPSFVLIKLLSLILIIEHDLVVFLYQLIHKSRLVFICLELPGLLNIMLSVPVPPFPLFGNSPSIIGTGS